MSIESAIVGTTSGGSTCSVVGTRATSDGPTSICVRPHGRGGHAPPGKCEVAFWRTSGASPNRIRPSTSSTSATSWRRRTAPPSSVNLESRSRVGFPAGRLTVYALPSHRTWRFAGAAGRFRPAAKMDEQQKARGTSAWATRWDLRTRRFEIAVSHFNGVSREPTFEAAADAFRVGYPRIQQTSAELQLLAGAGLLKLDVVQVRSHERRSFSGFTIGGEWPLTLGAGDLTVVAEFTYDQRGMEAPTGADRDLLVAARWTANNAAGTEATASSMIDVRSGAQTLRASVSRRLSSAWRWTAESHVLVHPEQAEFAYWLRRDSFLQVTLACFF